MICTGCGSDFEVITHLKAPNGKKYPLKRCTFCRQETNRKRRYAAKLEGVAHYGGKCSCCGETEPGFLTIEHKEGRDKSIIRQTGNNEWARLKVLGWPDYIELRCYNCNCAKGALGFCPHEMEQ